MKSLIPCLLVSSVVAASVATRAEACTAPACRESWSAPVAGKSIPANAPAIVLVQGTSRPGEMLTPAPPTLKNGAGPIAATRDGDFLRPSAALPVGSVTLQWDETCNTAGDAGISTKELAFTVVDASPLPTALGSATLSYSRGDVDVVTTSGSCTDKLDAAQAHFTFALDPALVKFRDVARFVTKVDGMDWGASAWGREGPLGLPSPFGGDMGVHRHDLVFAACGASPMGVTDRGVAVGKHSVEIRAEVAGGPAIPAATFDIELVCDGTPPDGGTVTPDAAPDTGAPVDDRPPVVPGTPDSSCTTTAPHSSHAGIPLLAIALAFVAARRRSS